MTTYRSQDVTAGAMMMLQEQDVAAGVKMWLQEKLFKISFLLFWRNSFSSFPDSQSFRAAILGFSFARSQCLFL